MAFHPPTRPLRSTSRTWPPPRPGKTYRLFTIRSSPTSICSRTPSPLTAARSAPLHRQRAPANGVTSENSDGTYNYTPKADWSGTDSFTFTVTDGILTGLPATVNITVTETPPTAMNAEYSTLHDQALTVDAWDGVLANVTEVDGGALAAMVVQSSPYVTLASDGSFVCTPPAAWAGDITFTYAASDGIAQSNTATVTIHVTDQAPVAANYDFTLHAGLVLSLDATSGLMHDSYDPDYDPMTAQQVGMGATNGTERRQLRRVVHLPGKPGICRRRFVLVPPV